MAAQPQPTGPSTAGKRLFARIHIGVYRLTRGVLGHRLGPVRTLILTTIGQKTGKRRGTPITYFADGDAFVLIASNYGADTDPLWLRNLRKQPHATIQVGAKILKVVAAEAVGSEKARLAMSATRFNPTYTRYVQGTSRDIPLVVLRPEPTL